MRNDIVYFYNGDKSFHFNNRKYLGQYEMKNNHFHNSYEIYYLVSGERNYFIKDRSYLVKKGDLVLINRNELHKTYNAESPDHHRILINFEEGYAVRANSDMKNILEFLFCENSPVISLPVNEQMTIEETFNTIAKEIEHKGTGYEICVQTKIIALLIFCARYKEANVEIEVEHLSPIHEKIFEIVKFINENYSESLSLPYISSHFYISPYYLSRIFKESTGFTFVEYINSVRVQQAQRLLRDTNLSVTDIAERVGFGSIAHFGRIFKAVTKKSPLNYRKTSKSP